MRRPRSTLARKGRISSRPCGPPNDTMRTESNIGKVKGGSRGLPGTSCRSHAGSGAAEADGGEAGIRTLGRTLKALQRFSKPPPSASRPPHRRNVRLRDTQADAQRITDPPTSADRLSFE